MKKIIQIIEGRTISCLTEDGKVYHWLTFYTDGKQRVFDLTEEEKKTFEKKREWVQLEDCEGIKFYTEARKKELEEKDPITNMEETANDTLTEGQVELVN